MSTKPADVESTNSTLVAALAPTATILTVLFAHGFLPDRQSLPPTWMDPLPTWQRPYPAMLGLLFAPAIVLLFLTATWPASRAWVRHNAPLFAGLIAVLGIWDLLTQKSNLMRLPYFPGPDLVLGSMVDDRSLLVESAYHSLMLLLSGYAAGVAFGIATGVVVGWFTPARYWGMPALKIVGPLPATALVPLVMTLFNDSFLPATALIGYAVWFPVTILTVSGIASVNVAHLDVARTLGARPAYLILHVAFPSALPHIFIGLFMGLGASFLTLIVAETVGVQAGLGWYVKWQQGYMEYAKVYGALIIMIVFFSTLMTLLFKIRDRVLRWQKGIIQW